MSAHIRLIVCDIDGTLVRRDKSLSDGVIAAIGRARGAGLAISLISAHPPSGMLGIARRLGLVSALGAFNGGTIIRPSGEVLSAQRLEPTCAAATLALLAEAAVTSWLFANGQWYAQTVDEVYVPLERRAASIEPVIRKGFAGLLGHVDKIVGVSGDKGLLDRLEAKATVTLGTAADVGRSQPYYLDITAPGANKGEGLSTLAMEFGVALEEVAVIGDQQNDLPMFARAGLSIAMGQAPESVRAAADRVTSSNEEDGVAHAIDGFILAEIAR